ncbi:MAG: NADH-quinone oxidoreductase subunit F, partial [Oscillospiraceae bacterium]|nr:NADH-quinone oxidoreductase subunit F [Oscillospiraceae bacterium]
MRKITVGMGSCGIAAGADAVFESLIQKGANPTIVGCNGACYLEPIVTVDDKVYTKVSAQDVDAILGGTAQVYADNNADSIELRIALRNCGHINPENIDEYIARGGYTELNMTPEQIIETVKTAGIGGRGGAGFPTWFKWDAARRASAGKTDSVGDVEGSGQKYIICNADEGDPGAFMDRAIIEGDPHSVIEGMMIGARAIGASKGIVYVRAEYPLAITRLQKAIDQATARGYLGNGFTLRIKAGAGAFVCGEETALIASLEGERGMPRLKPPFPAQKGYW